MEKYFKKPSPLPQAVTTSPSQESTISITVDDPEDITYGLQDPIAVRWPRRVRERSGGTVVTVARPCGYCVVTVWLLCGHCVASVWSRCVASVWSRCVATVWSLCVATVWSLCGYCVVTVWLVCGHWLWLLCGHCAWLLWSLCVATVWSRCVATVWLLCGYCVVTVCGYSYCVVTVWLRCRHGRTRVNRAWLCSSIYYILRTRCRPAPSSARGRHRTAPTPYGT
jgi:hypothetical protein